MEKEDDLPSSDHLQGYPGRSFGRTARAQALAECNRAFAKRPTALHRVARAKVYLALGQLEAAKEDLRLAVQAAPRFTEAQDLLKKLEAQ